MDGTRFDHLVRALLTGGAPRRLVLRLSALPLAGGLAAFLLDDHEGAAKKRKNKKKKKRKKRKNKATCSGGDVCASGCSFSSVQDAIDDAEPGATITICAGTFTGNLTIAKDLTLVGTGEDATTLRGNGNGTVVTIEAGTVKLQDLRITGGAGAEFGGGIYNAGTLTLTGCTVTGNNTDNGYGNGIYNAEIATLTVEDCTISENGLDAPGAPYGGAIYNEGALSVTNSALTGNRANYGAALYDFSNGGVTLTGCDISDNVAFDDPDFEESGGAIYTEGLPTLTITDCTIRNNSGARYGGGVSLHTGAVFTNCEISGNSAIQGGGIYNAGDLTLDNTDVTSNTADEGGGIYTFGQAGCTNGTTLSGNSPDQCFEVNNGACDLCTAP
jgi:hypothetical protein